jgi:hypothetical protein
MHTVQWYEVINAKPHNTLDGICSCGVRNEGDRGSRGLGAAGHTDSEGDWQGTGLLSERINWGNEPLISLQSDGLLIESTFVIA